ncbi:MAG: hypothetical protein ACYC1C_04670 [Chloroflexota bacterium]
MGWSVLCPPSAAFGAGDSPYLVQGLAGAVEAGIDAEGHLDRIAPGEVRGPLPGRLAQEAEEEVMEPALAPGGQEAEVAHAAAVPVYVPIDAPLLVI